jgi:hypothetical protein
MKETEGPRESQAAMSLSQVARRLDGAGVTWAVFAGAAASVFGATRPITDVDILIPAAAGRRAAGLFPEGDVHHYPDGTIVVILPGFDLVALCGNVELDREMARRLMRHNILGVDVPVIPPEDNMLFKGLMGRGPEQGKHDWEDVEAMIGRLRRLWQEKGPAVTAAEQAQERSIWEG